MARIEMKYNYQFSGKYRYYPGPTRPQGSYDIGLSAFVINHLNLTRREISFAMANMQRRAESQVRKKSRVDTGAMRRQVMSTGDFGTDILKVRFGWEAFAPYYAPFQEFGTRKGIEPMFAVYDAYREAVVTLRNLVRGRR